MNYFKHIISLVLLLTAIVPFKANAQYVKLEDISKIADSLKLELKNTNDYNKQKIILLNLSDIIQKKRIDTSANYARQLYFLAKERKDYKTIYECLKNLSMQQYPDSLTANIKRIDELPDSELKKGLKVYFEYYRASIKRTKDNDSITFLNYKKYLEHYTSLAGKNVDTYTKYKDLLILSTYTPINLYPSYYEQYLNQLDSMSKSFCKENSYLTTAVLINKTNFLINQNRFKDAVPNLLKLIDHLKELEDSYRSQGRIYREYSTFYYRYYRQLLSCYTYLPIEDVDLYYKKLVETTQTNQLLKAKFEGQIIRGVEDRDYRPHIYYYMAHKQYDKALPLINKELKINKVQTMSLLEEKIAAAKALGNQSEENDALNQYVKISKNFYEKSGNLLLKELYVANKLDSLSAQNSKLESIALKRAIIILIVFTVFLFLITGIISHFLLKTKKNAKQLEIAKERAENANKTSQMFLQNMSHEIRTPLNAVVGFSQLIANEMEDKEPTYKEWADIIKDNSNLMSKLVNDILEITALETLAKNTDYKEIDITNICHSAIESVREKLKPGVELIYKSTLNSNYTINSDKNRLFQLLINLLGNSAKFTETGSITLSTNLLDDNKTIEISVSDTGCGIPKDKANDIFERFNKLDTFKPGNGLGLHICRLIVNNLNGTIKVDTDYSNGARFVLTLPTNNN